MSVAPSVRVSRFLNRLMVTAAPSSIFVPERWSIFRSLQLPKWARPSFVIPVPTRKRLVTCLQSLNTARSASFGTSNFMSADNLGIKVTSVRANGSFGKSFVALTSFFSSLTRTDTDPSAFGVDSTHSGPGIGIEVDLRLDDPAVPRDPAARQRPCEVVHAVLGEWQLPHVEIFHAR